MRLVTYTHPPGEPRLGAVLVGNVIDLAEAYAALGRDRPGLPMDMLTFLQGGDESWQKAREVIEWVSAAGFKPTTQPFTLPLSDVRLGPPIGNPGKIICLGLNYADHCREQNLESPKSPVLFAKFPTALIGPEESITWPEQASHKVDYEAELAIVIGRVCRRVSVEEAADYIAGYTILNDVSARDAQFADGQWVRGKSFDTFCPMGPYLVTPDEVGDPHRLTIRCWLNGQLMQDSNTGEMIFKIPDIIAFISQTCTLLPGDVISTGTPAGVGVFRKPPVFMKPGDLVEIEIERLGRLRNPVR